jgi:hypothetical protein
MMRQVLKQAWPGRGHGGLRPAVTSGLRPAVIGGIAAPKPGAATIVWRQRAPRVPLRQCVAEWRARNWRRVVLAWFVLSLIIVAIAAEPSMYFPKAQARSAPAVRTVLRVTGGVTVAGVPVLLIALP